MVVLHARSLAASKLISVVEITKREVEKEGGKWWQYSRISKEIRELKEKVRGEKSGISLKEWEEGMGKEASSVTGTERDKGEATAAEAGKVGAEEEEANSPEEDEEDVFETMPDKKAHPEREVQKKKKKIRAVPVMTIYMSRVPVPEFRKEFGYVHHQSVLYLTASC